MITLQRLYKQGVTTIGQQKLNDLCKVVPILTGIIAMGISFSSIDLAYGESDLTLEAKVKSSPQDATDLLLDVTRFEISAESDKQICPSGQCNIELVPSYFDSFETPSADSQKISYDITFKVHDNDNQTNIGPVKKRFMEPFRISTGGFGCTIDDIIENNGQEIYYCHGINIMNRFFDNARWNYDINGIYDAKNSTLKVIW